MWACLLLKNDPFLLALLKLLTPEKFKRGNVMEKKVDERRKKTRRGK